MLVDDGVRLPGYRRDKVAEVAARDGIGIPATHLRNWNAAVRLIVRDAMAADAHSLITQDPNSTACQAILATRYQAIAPPFRN